MTRRADYRDVISNLLGCQFDSVNIAQRVKLIQSVLKNSKWCQGRIEPARPLRRGILSLLFSSFRFFEILLFSINIITLSRI